MTASGRHYRSMQLHLRAFIPQRSRLA